MDRRTPQQARAKEKVEKILLAARRLIEEEGPAALNTNRIAKEAGLGVGSLYEYFGSKQQIAHALIERLSAQEASQIVQRLEGATEHSIEATIRKTVELTVALYEKNHRLYHGLRTMAEVGRQVGHRPGEQEVLAAIQRWIEAHRDRLAVDDVHRASLTCFHLVESLAYQLTIAKGPRWSAKARSEEITKVVTRYLGVR